MKEQSGEEPREEDSALPYIIPSSEAGPEPASTSSGQAQHERHQRAQPAPFLS